MLGTALFVNMPGQAVLADTFRMDTKTQEEQGSFSAFLPEKTQNAQSEEVSLAVSALEKKAVTDFSMYENDEIIIIYKEDINKIQNDCMLYFDHFADIRFPSIRRRELLFPSCA